MTGAMLIVLAVVSGLLAARAALPALRFWWRARGAQLDRDEDPAGR